MSGLRDQAAGRSSPPVGNDLAVVEAEAVEQMGRALKSMESQFQMAMPKGVEAVQLVRDAMTLLRKTPKLALCDQGSFFGGLMTMAQLGLRPGVLGHGWLIPFWERGKSGQPGKNVAQLVIGYQGLSELAYRSNQIASIAARTVYENDPVFDVEFGSEDRILHKPLMDGDPGKPIAYYCVAHIKGGRPLFYVKGQKAMEEYRDRYAMARINKGKADEKIVGPWIDNFEGMAQKTCLRQLSKWMPKSVEFATALAVDEGVRVNYEPNVTPEAATVHVEQVPNDQEGTQS